MKAMDLRPVSRLFNQEEDPMRLLLPVRYPLNGHSRETLEHAVELSEEGDDFIVLHVDLYQDSNDVSRRELRRQVENAVGEIDAGYVVRRGFVVEESILEEAIDSDIDVIVIGKNRSGKLRRAMRRMVGNDPRIEEFLSRNFDARIEVVD